MKRISKKSKRSKKVKKSVRKKRSIRGGAVVNCNLLDGKEEKKCIDARNRKTIYTIPKNYNFRTINGGCDKYDRCNYCSFQSEKDYCENDLRLYEQSFINKQYENQQYQNQNQQTIYQSKKNPNMNSLYEKYNIH